MQLFFKKSTSLCKNANKHKEKISVLCKIQKKNKRLAKNHKIVYRVIGFDGGSCIDLLGICDTLNNADKFIIEKHEELEKNNIYYPYYDVEEIEL